MHITDGYRAIFFSRKHRLFCCVLNEQESTCQVKYFDYNLIQYWYHNSLQSFISWICICTFSSKVASRKFGNRRSKFVLVIFTCHGLYYSHSYNCWSLSGNYKELSVQSFCYSWKTCYCCWVVCAVLNFLPAPEDAYMWNVPATQYYIFLGIHIIISLIVIAMLYRKITVKLWREETGKTKVQSREVRLAKRLSVVIIFLFIVLTPVVLLEIFYNFDFSHCIVKQAGTVSVWITCANGALNPIVYSRGNAEVKKCIRCMFGCKHIVASQLDSRISGR